MVAKRVFTVVLFVGLSKLAIAQEASNRQKSTLNISRTATSSTGSSESPLTHSFTGPNIQLGEVDYINAETFITLSVSSSRKPENAISFSIDGGEMQPYSNPLQIKDSGRHNITFTTQDDLQKKSFVVFNDSEGPELSISFTFKSIRLGSVEISGDNKATTKEKPKYPLGTTLTLLAEDNYLKVPHLTFQMDDSAEIPYKEPFTLPKGKHLLTVVGKDELGNETILNNISFEIVIQ